LSESLLTIEAVTKSYGHFPVIRELSLAFKPGECTLLLGANGAGKSTLLRMCASLLRPDKGSIHLGGKALAAKDLGYCGHQALLYGELTVAENLRLTAELMNVSTPIDSILARWELESRAKTRVNALSKGLQVRASLARGLLHRPRCVFLDEPSSALDEHSLDLLRTALLETNAHHQGQAIFIIATHDIARLRSLAGRAVVLSEGILAKDSLTKGATADSVVEYYLEHNR